MGSEATSASEPFLTSSLLSSSCIPRGPLAIGMVLRQHVPATPAPWGTAPKGMPELIPGRQELRPL